MRKHLRRPVLVLAMSAIMVGVMVAPAGAAQKAKNTKVAGVAVLDWIGEPPTAGGETCPELEGEFGGEYDTYVDFTMVLDGDLEGCWYTLIDPDSIKLTPSGAYSEAGIEVFISSDGVSSFETTYSFHGKFTDTFDEIHGRCQHLITPGTGTGDYEDATGRINFKDDVDAGINYYKGHMRTPKVP